MSIQLSLLDRYGNVHEQAGLNWGYSYWHVSYEDAYIPLKTSTIRNNPCFFSPISQENIIYVTWDDGVVMKCLLEGRQEVNNVIYAKQISSHNDKSLIGHYLRQRLNVFNRRITLDDLNNYGQTDIIATKIDNTHYHFDFSVN